MFSSEKSMNLGSQSLVSKQSTMPSSSGASRNSAGAGDAGGNSSDQFPAGLRVLVVDDDPTCLMILEKMLRNCNYEVTKCNRAEVALSLLRENKNGYDVVISDVHMPDMDGFKLLVHIGLEMDLPVIMMSADDSKSVVMKGVTHGACDYLIKPVRMEALRNIWQHVVRKRKHEWKDNNIKPSVSLDEGDRQQQKKKQPEDPDYTSSANEGQNGKNTKRRKDDDDETEEKEQTSSSSKKPRVAWSMELHQQFVAAVNQLGFDKAVPKKILDLMNVPGITRENVASHLQKYRIYLRKLGGPQQSGAGASFMGNLDAGYGSLNELDLQTLAATGQLNQLPGQSLATLQAAGLGRSASSSRSSISAPLIDQRNIFSFENPNPRYGQVQNRQGHNGDFTKQTNLLHGVPTTMEPKQLAGFRHSFTGMNSQGLIPMTGQSQSQTHLQHSLSGVNSQGLTPMTGQSQSQTHLQHSLSGMNSQGLIPMTGQSQSQTHLQHSLSGTNSQGLIPMTGQSQSQTHLQHSLSGTNSQGLIPMTCQSQTHFQHSLSGMNSQGLIPMTGQSQTHDLVSRQPVLSNATVGNMSGTTTAMYNPTTSQAATLVPSSGLTTSNSFPLRGSSVISPIMPTSTLQRDGNIENVQNRPQNWGLQGVDLTPNPRQHTNNMQGRSNAGGSKVIVSSAEGSWTHVTGEPSTVNQPFGTEEYNPEDLLTPFLTQQDGAGQAENEFGFDWYSNSDNLPV